MAEPLRLVGGPSLAIMNQVSSQVMSCVLLEKPLDHDNPDVAGYATPPEAAKASV